MRKLFEKPMCKPHDDTLSHIKFGHDVAHLRTDSSTFVFTKMNGGTFLLFGGTLAPQQEFMLCLHSFWGFSVLSQHAQHVRLMSQTKMNFGCEQSQAPAIFIHFFKPFPMGS